MLGVNVTIVSDNHHKRYCCSRCRHSWRGCVWHRESVFTTSPLRWIIGIILALPFFFTILFAPFLVLEGWYQLYVSNVWTLAYREMKAMESCPSGTIQTLVTSGE